MACGNCEKTKILLKEWINQQGHDRCWYYPDIFQEIMKVHNLNLEIQKSLPSLEEFKEGCRKYQEEEFNL